MVVILSEAKNLLFASASVTAGENSRFFGRFALSE
jgi:hypothetical protein